jgi:hypothetical protein
MGAEKYLCGVADSALRYHLLEAMIGTSAEPSVENFFIPEALDEMQRRLKVSPFIKSRVRRALREMTADGLVAVHRRGRRGFWRVADPGRLAYACKEAMVLWRLEKKFGKKLTLETVTQITPRKKGQDKLYMPQICFVRMPLAFRPVEHRFEADREIRICEVFLRSNPQ